MFANFYLTNLNPLTCVGITCNHGYQDCYLNTLGLWVPVIFVQVYMLQAHAFKSSDVYWSHEEVTTNEADSGLQFLSIHIPNSYRKLWNYFGRVVKPLNLVSVAGKAFLEYLICKNVKCVSFNLFTFWD